MNVLSLFDGISIGQLALKKVGIKVDTYYALVKMILNCIYIKDIKVPNAM